jgi:eukaryotic-like serine/threonine-protein kinase
VAKSSAALAPDLILGRYRPLRPLGSGGMGHVWLVRDERNGLDVALKMVGREGKSAARAEREAKAAAALRHPRCQRIYALARDSGHVYIAYEYVPGRTMRQALTAGELGDRAAVEVAAQVLEALAHAHGRGIVHRDVKPSNVLIAESDELDVRLLDFGLAQMEEFDTLTAIGDVPGTLAYVSPERLLGKSATAAADVWAVGVMLWEALAGRHPFRADDLGETSRRIQAGAPPLAEVRPDLPESLQRAVASALELNPARRPDAAKLATDLRTLKQKRKKKRRRQREQPAPARERARIVVRERLLPGVLAALWTGWVAASLPFYPAGWALPLAGAAGALSVAAPRAGIAVALAATFFPLANISLGLAGLFGVVATGWLALTWRDARSSLLLLAGPLLAPLGALALLPLLAQAARGTARRAAQAGAAVLLAAIVAGVEHKPLPFGAGAAPLGLGITGSRREGAVAYALWRALTTHPALLAETCVLAVAAALLPRARGPWPAAIYAAGLLAATALAAPAAPLAPLIAAAWITASILALSGPTTNRCSWLRRWETRPTRSPRGL